MPLCLIIFFFYNDTATTEIYTLSLHDALPISDMAKTQKYPVVIRTEIDYRRAAKLGDRLVIDGWLDQLQRDRKSTRLNSSHSQISYAVFCLKKKNKKKIKNTHLNTKYIHKPDH